MAPSATSLPFTELMALDRVGENTFHSRAKPYGPGLGETAFGGHVYAQAVYAASQTVAKGFVVHVCRCSTTPHPSQASVYCFRLKRFSLLILCSTECNGLFHSPRPPR